MTQPKQTTTSTDGIFIADITGGTNDHQFNATAVKARDYHQDWWELEGYQEDVEGDSKRWRRFSLYIHKSTKNGEHEYDPNNFFSSYIDTNHQGIIYRFIGGTLSIDLQPDKEIFKVTFNLIANRPHEPDEINVCGSLEMQGIDTSPQSATPKEISGDHIVPDALLPAPRILEAKGLELPLDAVKNGATLVILHSPEMVIGKTLHFRIKGRGAIFGTQKIMNHDDILIKTRAFPIYILGEKVFTDCYIDDHEHDSETAEYTVV